MILILQLGGYALLFWLLTVGGNEVCRLVLNLSAAKVPPEAGGQVTLRAGRSIGVLERLLVCLGLVAGSWEILAAVIALKTVARYAKLDDQNNAEYFLIGSLASLLWAAVATLMIVAFDRIWGFGAVEELMRLIGARPR